MKESKGKGRLRKERESKRREGLGREGKAKKERKEGEKEGKGMKGGRERAAVR